MPNNCDKDEYRVLSLGGGAPNFTLMSGALHALHEGALKDQKPNVVTMAGAGAVVGLLYLAPKGISELRALENTINFGISDLIYEMVPINYKAFAKSGLSADLFNDYWFSLPEVQAAMRPPANDAEALQNDALLFQGAMMCPTDVNFFSQGVCEHPRFIEELIDFDVLQAIDPDDIEIEINAFCIEEHKIVDFANFEFNQETKKPKCENGKIVKKKIDVDHLRAALSFPFIYPPYQIGQKHYYEGAAFETLNNWGYDDAAKIKWAVVIDPLRANFIGIPRNLWDAFALMVLMPTTGLAELARMAIEDASKTAGVLSALQALTPYRNQLVAALGQIPAGTKGVNELRRLLEALTPANGKMASALDVMAMKGASLFFPEFKIEQERIPSSWGWSRSSMQYLFGEGKRAGAELAKAMREHRAWAKP